MITAIEFPGKTFATKGDLFSALLKNEKKIISLKKAAIFDSEKKGQQCSVQLLKHDEATKAALGMKEGYVYAVINTAKYFDSHKDVHFEGLWNRSLKAQQGKLFYVADHKLELDSVIVWPQDIKAFVKTIPWAFVGKEFEGETEALIYEFRKDAITSEKALKAIEKGLPVQNSVRMRYVDIKMGINDTGKDYVMQKTYWDENINNVANKADAEAAGYMFGIHEAEISKEGSMVLFGSNDATATIYQESAESTSDKQTVDESLESTQKQQELTKVLTYYI